MADETDYKELAPMVHYGASRRYGNHIGIGEDGAKIHIYPQFIHIGGSGDNDRIPLTPRQIKLVSKIIEKMGLQPGLRGPTDAY